jgi:response regulator of citrate/malate metabolism
MVKEDLVFIIDYDLILNEIHTILLNKTYPNITIKSFTREAEAIQAIDNQELPATIFLDLHIPGERKSFFLEAHKTLKLTGDIYLMSSLSYIDDPDLLSTYPAIKDFISKPLLEHKTKPVFSHFA